MRRTLATATSLLFVSMLFIPTALPASGVGHIASPVHTIDTGGWLPSSPDPSGIAWWAAKGRLIVVDGEVEEMAVYAGANTFETSTDGTLLRTSTTFPTFSSEPTDVAADGNTVYFIDDNADRISLVDVGLDGDVGTADDTRTSFSTRTFNSQDPEGIAVGGGAVFVSDGNNNQIYRVEPGPNGLFDGTDDQTSCFDTSVLGMRDPEAVTIDPATGELFIVSRTDREVAVATTSGALTDLINLATSLPFTTQTVNPAGVAVAPASDDPSRNDLYISDRAVDNDLDPNENDGRIYEIRLDEPIGNLVPVVSGPGRQSVVEGEFVRLQIAAADPNDDPISYSATGLPPGLSVDPATGVISGTVAAGAAAGTPYSSALRANDGTASGSRNAVWDVFATGAFNTAPSIANPGDQVSSEGDSVNLPVGATDPDAGNVLMYSATGLPPGLWMDCLTGTISGTIAPGAASGSPYTVRASVGDQVVPGSPSFRSKWDAQTFVWTLGAPDTVPPQTPSGLVITSDSIGLHLDWANNTEPDLAGYNVYRDGSPSSLNPAPLTVSAFSDNTAPPGATSTYDVTAVDLAGNESGSVAGSAFRSKIAFRGSSSASIKPGNSIAVARPAGVQPGDLMLAAINVSGAPNTLTAPVGWTPIRADANGSGLKQFVFWKIAGDELPSYAWGLGGSFGAAGGIVAYSGVDAAAPFVVNAALANAKATSIRAPSVSASADQLLVAVFGIAKNTTITPPAGMVEHAEAIANGSKKVSIEISDDVLDATGATGVRIATTSGSTAVSVGQTLVLRPMP
jgi:hypothetical protein